MGKNSTQNKDGSAKIKFTRDKKVPEVASDIDFLEELLDCRDNKSPKIPNSSTASLLYETIDRFNKYEKSSFTQQFNYTAKKLKFYERRCK